MLAFAFVLLLHFAAASDFSDINANIDWKTLNDVRSPDFDWASNEKPVLYLFTQPWCGACNRLKETMTAEGTGKTRMELFAKQFVMVSIAGDDNDEVEDEFKPDGGYIPRVLFAGPDGKVNPNLTNRVNDKYKYFYTSAAQLANTMEEVLPSLGVHLNSETEDSSYSAGYEEYGEEAVEEGDEYEDVEDNDEQDQQEELEREEL